MAIDVLLVEDNPADVDLTREGFAHAKTAITLHHVVDGEQAVKFLRRGAPYEGAPRPAVILLDLNLPRRDGRAVLREIKTDGVLNTIPVIVLTSSAAKSDIAKCYELGANCYITKPMRFEEFQRVLESVEDFWFRAATLPQR